MVVRLPASITITRVRPLGKKRRLRSRSPLAGNATRSKIDAALFCVASTTTVLLAADFTTDFTENMTVIFLVYINQISPVAAV